MKLRRIIALGLLCIFSVGCFPTVYATEVCQPAIYMENLKWEQVDLENAGILGNNSILRGFDSISGTVAARSISVGDRTIYLPANSVVTINCSYSPSSANMDFGVVDSTGRFYYINVKEGSINQAIRISQSGNYAVAIRNNSSQTVRVVGFVEY